MQNWCCLINRVVNPAVIIYKPQAQSHTQLDLLNKTERALKSCVHLNWYAIALIKGNMMIVLIDLVLMLLDLTYIIISAMVRAVLRPRLKSVDGQLCLITGAGGGLGRLFALEFAREGAELVLWDCNTEANEKTAESVRELGCRAHAYTVDLTKRESIYQTADRVRKELGDVNILVNNAGVVAGRRLLECPDELLERTLLVNCHALFWVRRPSTMFVCFLCSMVIACVLGDIS